MCFKKDGVKKKKESDGLENGLATQSAGLFFLRRWLITICVSSSRDSNTSSESYMHKVHVPLCGEHVYTYKAIFKSSMTYAMYLPFYQTFQ